MLRSSPPLSWSSGLALFSLLLLLMGGALAGCDNTIEPFSETGAFSVHGNLRLADQPQYFRVKPLDQPISSKKRSLDATVVLTNQSTGDSRTLRDSMIVFGDAITHNYWDAFRPAPSTVYQLEVRGEKGITRVQTQTPTGVDPSVVPSRPETCKTPVQVTFREAKSPIQTTVGFRYEGEMHWVSRSSEIEPLQNQDDKRMVFLPQSVLATEVPGRFGEPRCPKLQHNTLYISFLYTGPVPGENLDGAKFDPTESRVTNGTGFFGAIRRDTVSLKVDTTRGVSSSED